MKHLMKISALVLGVFLAVMSTASSARAVLSVSSKDDLPTQAQPTMDSQVVFTGSAEPGTSLSCLVYQFNSRGEEVILYSSRDITADSGLYEIIAPLSVIGRQYVEITVGDSVTTRLYERYSRKTLEELRSYQLNIIEFLNEH